jgi:hypothetical protein
MDVSVVMDTTKGTHLHFDGDDDYMMTYTGLPAGSDARTMEMMVKTTSTQFGVLAWYGNFQDLPVNEAFGISMNSNGKVGLYGQLVDQPVASSPAINDGNWHHVALSYDGTTVRIYVDGVKVQENTRTLNTQYGTNPLYIGIWDPSITNNLKLFKGEMDEFRLWNRALTNSEISNRKDCPLWGNETGLSLYNDFNFGVGGSDNSNLYTDVPRWIQVTAKGAAYRGINFAKIGNSSNFLSGSPIKKREIPVPKKTAYVFNLNDTPEPIQVTGENLKWYTQATGGTASATTPIISTATSYTTSYWVSTTTTTGCESDRVKIDVTVNYKPGSDLHFDGVDDKITGSKPSLNGLNVGTIEFWMKTTQTSKAALFNVGNDAMDERLALFINNGNVEFSGNNANIDLIANKKVNDNKWHHIALVEENNSTPTFPFPSRFYYKVYVDGVLIKQNNIADRVYLPNNSSYSIGSAFNANYYNGEIDELRLWNRALTQTEVANGRYCEMASNNANLLLYYRFNEGLGFANNTALTTTKEEVANTGITLSNFAKTGTTSNFLPNSILSDVAALPTVNNISICKGATAQPLSATSTLSGAVLTWYTSDTATVGSTTAPTPTTNTEGVFNFWVTQKVANSTCESSRVKLTVTVNNSVAPDMPTTNTNVQLCKNATAAPLTATGTNIRWYSSATDTVYTTVSPNLLTTQAGTTSYWVTQRNAQGCESGRKKVDVTVNTLPGLPTTNDLSLCQGMVSCPMVATGANIKWYTTQIGGTGVTNIEPSTATLGTTQFWATQTAANGCESIRKTASATVTPSGLATTNFTENFTGSNGSFCSVRCDRQMSSVKLMGAGVNNIAKVTSTVWIESTQGTSVKRHYEITPKTSNNTVVENILGTITLYFSQQDFDAFNAVNSLKLPTSPTDITGKANLVFKKYSGTSSDGSGSKASYGANPTIVTINPDDDKIVWNADLSRWEVTFDVTSFSGLFAESESQVLPVELLSFEASSQKNGTNLLTWRTVTEQNANHFELQHGVNGIDFETMGQVKAKRQAAEYSFTHQNPTVATHYYRLKMVDNDGAFKISKVISLDKNGTKSLKVYPNPTKNSIQIITSDYTQPMRLYSINGVLIMNKNQTTEQLDVSALPTGMYFLHVGSDVMKVIKE